jgi:hypothetical protein
MVTPASQVVGEDSYAPIAETAGHQLSAAVVLSGRLLSGAPRLSHGVSTLFLLNILAFLDISRMPVPIRRTAGAVPHVNQDQLSGGKW